MVSIVYMYDNYCMYRYLCVRNIVIILSSYELLLFSWVIWFMDILFFYNLLNNKMGIKILVLVYVILICRIWMYLFFKF